MSGDAIIAEDASVVLGTFQALKGVSFRLPENAYLAILGPNGAGKTTLVRALMGLERLSGGCLQLFGGEPSAIDPSQVGYVPQLKTLDRRFPALPIELVVSGLRGSWPWRITGEERLRALNALRIAGMEDKAERPLGGLSGGEMQRVYLARAIVRHPRLVILDEPAAGMDVSGEADMYHVLEHYREDHEATVVMITHDWDVARHHATHVLLLNRTVLAFGTPDDVLTAKHLRRAFGHVGHHHPMTMEHTHE